MKFEIKVSIQEIVKDFEELVRYDERLGVQFDSNMANDEEIAKFNTFIMDMVNKYIPGYERHLDEPLSGEDTYEDALVIYRMLYENFREIFFNLI